MNQIENKKVKKANRIVKNPRFYNDVKEKLKDSIAILANARTGGQVDEEIHQQNLQNVKKYVKYKLTFHFLIHFYFRQRNKESSVISLIRRRVPDKDTRPFSAFPLRAQTLKFGKKIGNIPISPHTTHKPDNKSIHVIRGIHSGFCFKRTK